MKFIKIVLTLLFTGLVTVSNAQKIKIKNDIIFINKDKYGKIEDDKSVRYSFYLNDLENNNLLYFKWIFVEYIIIEGGKEEEKNLNYYEVYKADDLDNILYEEQGVLKYKSHMIKKLFNADALLKTGVDYDKLNIYAKKMGKEFSRMRDERRH